MTGGGDDGLEEPGVVLAVLAEDGGEVDAHGREHLLLEDEREVVDVEGQACEEGDYEPHQVAVRYRGDRVEALEHVQLVPEEGEGHVQAQR